MSWLTNHILTWIIFLPTLGAVLCLLAPKARSRKGHVFRPVKIM